jgi:hypothetical protein
MTSVSIDLFVMPEVEFEGRRLNVIAACVDRHSGWIVATAHHTKGLTAAQVAKTMYEQHWSPFGIPSIVTSDRGPHFAGAWWRQMCALHGVRHSFAQAHHHEANGRAESMGAQLQVRLRKLQAEEGLCWVEALPRAIRYIHDVPGQSGLSPYEILFGRSRPYAGIPYQPPTQHPDAIAFFEQQRQVDGQVAKALNELHEKRTAQLNNRRKELPALPVGSTCWYLRPRGRPGEKLGTYWIGPCRVVKREGQHSYQIEVQPGRQQAAHRSQLKEHTPDPLGKPLQLYHFKQAPEDVEAQPDEWLVEEIREHRCKNGDWEFKVKWQGSKQLTWEPLSHFFHRYSAPIIDYIANKDIKVDVVDQLRRHPQEEAMVSQLLAGDHKGQCWEGSDSDDGFSQDQGWLPPPTDWEWESGAVVVPISA